MMIDFFQHWVFKIIIISIKVIEVVAAGIHGNRPG